MRDITGKTVLMTGAAGNLGRALSQAFGARGARLALVDHDAAALRTAREALPPETESIALAVNLLAPDEVAAMVDQVATRFGRIDVLANLAGGFGMGPPIHETADAEWDFMLDINVRTLFHCARATIPRMLEARGGHIINVSARAATKGIGHMGPYCAAKAAVITLTESLADELKEADIKVNCVLPGTLDTPQNRAAMPNADHSTWVSLDALADVILFLASDASRGITGAAIPVYGRS